MSIDELANEVEEDKTSGNEEQVTAINAYSTRELIHIDFKELTFLGSIGKGSFGIVHEGIWRGVTVAIKKVETATEVNAFENEILQLSRVSHENIICMYGVAVSLPMKCLVMEFADGGSLFQFLHCQAQNNYSIVNSLSWLLQCARAMNYLHSFQPKAIIHRDLKPLNMLLTKGRQILKVCDFGTACILQTFMTDNRGSFAWMAPEVMRGDIYDEKCDVYSWGIILWEVLTRRIPFDEWGQPARIIWQVTNSVRPPLIQGCPKPLQDLMTRCWMGEHTLRPSMAEVLRVILPLYRLVSGGEDPIPYSGSEDSPTESCMSTSNQMSTDGHTSQEGSDLPYTMGKTKKIAGKNHEEPSNCGDFVMVPRVISPNVSTSIVVSANNLCPPWGSAASDDLYDSPRPTDTSQYPIGTCIDYPHVPRSVLNGSSQPIDPGVFSPLSITIPQVQEASDQLGVPRTVLSPRPPTLCPSVPYTLSTPLGNYANGLLPPSPSSSYCPLPQHVHMMPPLGFHPPRAVNLPDHSPQPQPFDDWHLRAGNQSHVAVNRDDLGAFCQLLDDDLKPSMPLPACPQSQKVCAQQQQLAHKLLIVQEEIFYLDQKKNELTNQLTDQETTYKSCMQRYTDKVLQLQNKNECLRRDHGRLKEQVDEIRSRKRQLAQHRSPGGSYYQPAPPGSLPVPQSYPQFYLSPGNGYGPPHPQGHYSHPEPHQIPSNSTLYPYHRQPDP